MVSLHLRYALNAPDYFAARGAAVIAKFTFIYAASQNRESVTVLRTQTTVCASHQMKAFKGAVALKKFRPPFQRQWGSWGKAPGRTPQSAKALCLSPRARGEIRKRDLKRGIGVTPDLEKNQYP